MSTMGIFTTKDVRSWHDVPFFYRLVGLFLIGAGLLHGFFIFGIFSEKAPIIITLYFHCLGVLDIVAGVGILLNKKYCFFIAIFIAITQFVAHGYLIYLDSVYLYGGGRTLIERYFEITLSVALLLFAWKNIGKSKN